MATFWWSWGPSFAPFFANNRCTTKQGRNRNTLLHFDWPTPNVTLFLARVDWVQPYCSTFDRINGFGQNISLYSGPFENTSQAPGNTPLTMWLRIPRSTCCCDPDQLLTKGRMDPVSTILTPTVSVSSSLYESVTYSSVSTCGHMHTPDCTPLKLDGVLRLQQHYASRLLRTKKIAGNWRCWQKNNNVILCCVHK